MPLSPQVLTFGRAMFAAILLSGCSQLPDGHEDLAPVTAASFSTSGIAPVDAHWWSEFDDPQLTRLVDTAFTSNISLKSAVARVQRTAALAQVETASLYPELKGTINSDYQRGRTSPDTDISSNNSHSVKLSAGWEVDLWGGNRAGASAAYFNLLAEEEQLQTAAQSLAGNIARTWFQLTEQHLSLTILSRQIANTKVIAEITGHRYRTGQGSISAQWRQEQLLESLQAQKKQAEKRLQILEKQMNVLLGRSPMAPADWQYADFPDLPPLPDAGLPASLLERRPDVRGLWYQYQARQQEVAVAGAARLPSFTINTGLSTNDWSNAFELWRLNLGAQLNIPLFNAGKLASQQDAAEASAELAFYNYTQGVLTALQEVETNFLEELSQQEQLDSLLRRTQQAQQILEVESIRYSRGMQGYLDVLNAQEKLFTLQQQTLNTQRQLFLRRIATYQSLGGGLIALSGDGEIELQPRTES